ncbi:divalent metal cation transporter [Listeria ivanovii]|uniref:Nramp family divalent metal transporter n=1 Tax=Listeria ivanovii TaxID=1638 RepID=UPI000DA7BCD0|nr:Nramp family divalent metal transporter [Listeria ivanovii]PZF89850.1 divalent metal cation transporter [Listeria ivanovii]PZF95358.1 divalent metal cation transporter [Listeria ivanovii]PZG05715.1 divalent metal cation transporter [Listeria ivanovii]PZG10522.1 divalent metal cation transporter [Listeria ivanovii]PZG27337.1 divalent metal cation transporter [Listeria ivanovii]
MKKEKAERTKESWRKAQNAPSLSEVNNSVAIPKDAKFFRKLLAFMGPGALIAVGYVDPGNWATSIAGGSEFGYTLLSVILISNILAVLLQSLASKLGIVTGRDLAQASSDSFSKPFGFVLWILAELAIIATDIAEVIGSAIALNLLFGIPLIWGVCITALDIFLVLFLQHKGFRYIEVIVITLMVTILVCFGAEMVMSHPDVQAIAKGFIPQAEIVTNPAMLYIALGILGATVMPHNLYLHSSIVQTRQYARTKEGKKEAICFSFIDSTFSLTIALLINASILILAAAAFYTTGQNNVAGIEDAYKLLNPTLGSSIASTVFAVALLASGQNSTLTGTLAGQIVMEGFLNIRLKPVVRRLLTRFLAIVPAVIITALYGANGINELLIFSQVILSMQLSFAVIPLVMFTSDKRKMGDFVNPPWLKIISWAVAIFIAVLNIYLLFYTLTSL